MMTCLPVFSSKLLIRNGSAWLKIQSDVYVENISLCMKTEDKVQEKHRKICVHGKDSL